ncbi:hypothetical protein [Lacticaseibacillus paracasei]|uniref:hypothetical protein n=1 Tax=Lacticaseibacillus paracasei TaxID=1597 RepID=UPI0009A2C051|nr:hypothetical protein [Lacticaseibacillus paracasei]OPH00871.1 hypothetical protein B4586_13855 [Lacticaseibacillus paracasei]
MDCEEFETYLNANSRVVAIFRSQALTYQHSRNRQRSASKRWSETAVTSVVDKMVSQFIGLKSIFETDFKRHSEPRLPSTVQINH